MQQIICQYAERIINTGNTYLPLKSCWVDMADPHPGASPYSLWKSHLSLAGSILAASFLYILLKEKKKKKFTNTVEKKPQVEY